MDHRFRTHKVSLHKLKGGSPKNGVVKLNYGCVFENQLLDKKITNKSKDFIVISVRIGIPFFERYELFHIEVPNLNDQVHTLGGPQGCIPKFFIISSDSTEMRPFKKYLENEQYLIPVVATIHSKKPDVNHDYECNIFYLKLDQTGLDLFEKAILEHGENLQAGIFKNSLNIDYKFFKKINLLDINGTVISELAGLDYVPGDLG